MTEAPFREPEGPGDSGVRIREVSTVVVDAGMRNWVFVKVTTDEDGLHGWGEATLEWHTNAVVGAVADLAPLVVGQDPLRIEHLWQQMYRDPFFRGGAVSMSALSGLDQALHDIAGKHLGVPAYVLMGGRVRDHVRMYDHLGGGRSSEVYGSHEAGDEDLAALARRSVSDGFDALKLLPLEPSGAMVGTAAIDRVAERVGQVRDAVGPDVDIMLDLHGRTSWQSGIAIAKAVEPLRPWFLEEPCQPEDTDALALVARSTTIPIAAGERRYGRHEFRPLLERSACAVVQPDVCHAGGITELRRIAAMAETYGVSVAPHNPLGPVATMANVHLALCMPNFLVQEVMRQDVPWREDVVGGSPAISGGRLTPPTAPGLGIEVDERAAAEHPYVPEPQLRTRLADGSVGDW